MKNKPAANRRRRVRTKVLSLLTLVSVATLAGMLVAGATALPTTAFALAGRDLLTGIDPLTTQLPQQQLPERSRVLNADGSVLAYFYDEDRVYVPLSKVSPTMIQAQLAIEDHRFYEHGAIDLTGLARAATRSAAGNTQGGSTITMQYVRLALVQDALSNQDAAAQKDATEDTLGRKIREARIALEVEKQLSKDEILERYLNISYYGDGAYGVESAARHYFGVAAQDLDLAQSAMLAGLVQNPSLNPVTHPREAISRRNDVVNRMVSLDLITMDEANAAKQQEFDAKHVRPHRLGCANSSLPFVCDYTWRTLLQTESLGADPAEREATVLRGGLTVQTTIDPKVQKKAEKRIASYVSAKDPVVAQVTLVEPGTGRIVAMAQNRTKMGDRSGATYYNYAASQAMGGADGYQGGSTFKAFVAAAALEAGMGAYTTYNAAAHLNFRGETFKSCDGPITIGDWPVDNASPSGVMNLFTGAKYSVNTYFAQLIQEVGVCDAVKMADRLGLEVSSGADLVATYGDKPAFTFGAAEVTPLSMATAYATFAARGIRCDPVIIDSIQTTSGQTLAAPDGNCERVISEGVADAVSSVLQGPYNGGTATAAKVPGLQMAGKTGTVSSNKAVWTVGYTPELAGAAVLSYDNNPLFAKFWRKHPGYLRGVKLPASGRWLSGFSGDNAGRHLLRPVFADAIKQYEPTRFHQPPDDVLQGDSVDIPSCVGRTFPECQTLLADAGFRTRQVKVSHDRPVGALVGVSPSSRAPRGSSITLKVSTGPAPGSKAFCAVTPSHQSCPVATPTPAPITPEPVNPSPVPQPDDSSDPDEPTTPDQPSEPASPRAPGTAAGAAGSQTP